MNGYLEPRVSTFGEKLERCNVDGKWPIQFPDRLCPYDAPVSHYVDVTGFNAIPGIFLGTASSQVQASHTEVRRLVDEHRAIGWSAPTDPLIRVGECTLGARYRDLEYLLDTDRAVISRDGSHDRSSCIGCNSQLVATLDQFAVERKRIAPT